MNKIRKHLTAIIVFIINLVLVGVGFLFIKNGEEAKNKNANLADENVGENAITENEKTAENVAENPTTEESSSIVPEEVVPEAKNIPSSTAPVIVKPKAATPVPVPAPTPKSSAKTKTS